MSCPLFWGQAIWISGNEPPQRWMIHACPGVVESRLSIQMVSGKAALKSDRAFTYDRPSRIEHGPMPVRIIPIAFNHGPRRVGEGCWAVEVVSMNKVFGATAHEQQQFIHIGAVDIGSECRAEGVLFLNDPRRIVEVEGLERRADECEIGSLANAAAQGIVGVPADDTAVGQAGGCDQTVFFVVAILVVLVLAEISIVVVEDGSLTRGQSLLLTLPKRAET